jgi:hypothetical protein
LQVKYPYHLGVLDNIRAVLGPRLWLACWPQKAPGNGLHFPVGEGIGKSDDGSDSEVAGLLEGDAVDGRSGDREEVGLEERRWRREENVSDEV